MERSTLPPSLSFLRAQIVSRIVVLPGVRDADAPQAIGFQLDSLHPWGDDDVAWAWQRIGQSSSFSVVIAQRELVDRYASLLSEAGIRLAGFTSSGSALFFAARLGEQRLRRISSPYADGRPAWPRARSRSMRRAPRTRSTMRCSLCRWSAPSRSPARKRDIEDGVETADWVDILPRWNSAPDSLDLSDAGRSRLSLAWAAALDSACPHLGSPLNLLPPDLRAQSSRLSLVPPLVLGAALLRLAPRCWRRTRGSTRAISAH